ncbi:hypothetical protein PR202_gb20018 [Eleusine coracana subsp. coracana]|uniref:Uncharacterized protein n=1 Tax=Eleusine coracana subsp. coracana TaxID=191504 RepID=A0AAV5F9P8_ELECO|nr:hypothetical protein PR202_gb20018 [Eleusine coracana subsp. coracana]
MAKQSCCHKKKLRRGLWSPEEDEKLMNHIAKWSQIAAQLPGRTDNEVKNFWNSYIKKKLREHGIDPATHKPLADAAAASDVATATASRAVFCDAELIPPTTTTPLQQAPLPEPLLDGVVNKLPLDWTTAAGYLQAGCNFDIPAASSSSTLTSMADAEHCNNIASTNLMPWLELGPNAGHVDSYAGALDELRWSEYFDGAFQAAASQQGALQGQCVYGGKDDVAAADRCRPWAKQLVLIKTLSTWAARHESKARHKIQPNGPLHSNGRQASQPKTRASRPSRTPNPTSPQQVLQSTSPPLHSLVILSPAPPPQILALTATAASPLLLARATDSRSPALPPPLTRVVLSAVLARRASTSRLRSPDELPAHASAVDPLSSRACTADSPPSTELPQPLAWSAPAESLNCSPAPASSCLMGFWTVMPNGPIGPARHN